MTGSRTSDSIVDGSSAEGSGHAATRAIGRATALLMLGNLTGSVLGFVRQASVVDVFGQGSNTDAFFTASLFPQMFYDLTIGAAVSAALIPTLTETLDRHGRADLWRVTGNVLAIAWLALCVVVAGLLLAARPLVHIIAQGIPGTRGAYVSSLTVELARLLIPSLLFLGTSAVLLSTLYSLRRFAVPAFAPSLYHLGVIFGALALAGPLGIRGLAVGALIGSAAQAAALGVALLRERPHIRPRLALSPEARQIVRLYAPVAAGLVVSVAGQIVDAHFKLTLGRGSFAAMQSATQLTQFPIGIVVAALSFAVMPTLSSDAAFARMAEFKHHLAFGIRLSIFLTLPAAVGLVMLADPIVTLLLQYHHFQRHDTFQTASALAGYAIQIPFVGLDQLLIFAFYARKNTLTPMAVGVVGVGIYIVSALALRYRLHVLGLALANTIQNSSHALILLVLLMSTLGWFHGSGMIRSLGISLIAVAAMSVVVLITLGGLHAGHLSQAHLLERTVWVGLPILLAVSTYLGVHLLLRSEEVRWVRETVSSHLVRAPGIRAGSRSG